MRLRQGAVLSFVFRLSEYIPEKFGDKEYIPLFSGGLVSYNLILRDLYRISQVETA